MIWILSIWLFFNLLVVIRLSPADMYIDLVKEQNIVGKICGNAFYAPAWIIKIIWYVGKHYFIKLCKLIWQGIKYIFFAIARFIQQIYHSIFDIL